MVAVGDVFYENPSSPHFSYFPFPISLIGGGPRGRILTKKEKGRGWDGGWLGSQLGGGDVQLPANLSCQQDFNFPVPGEGGNMPIFRV
jgi:hypothetical protein